MSDGTVQSGEAPKTTLEFAGRLANVMESCADRIGTPHRQSAEPNATPIDYLVESTEVAGAGTECGGNLKGLVSAISELQLLLSPLPSTRDRR